MSSLLGFIRLRTTSYNPKCNGFIERAHRTLKNSLTTRKEGWLSALPIVLMGLRTQPHSDLGCSR